MWYGLNAPKTRSRIDCFLEELFSSTIFSRMDHRQCYNIYNQIRQLSIIPWLKRIWGIFELAEAKSWTVGLWTWRWKYFLQTGGRSSSQCINIHSLSIRWTVCILDRWSWWPLSACDYSKSQKLWTYVESGNSSDVKVIEAWYAVSLVTAILK
jgi:hypothetical protein